MLWGLFWWPLKELEAVGIHGSFVQAVAYGLPALVLLPWAVRNPVRRNQIGLLLLIALLGGWANAAFATSLTTGSVVRVLLLFYLAPVWTILAARLFLGEIFTRLRLVALGLALTGLAFTLGGPEVFDCPAYCDRPAGAVIGAGLRAQQYRDPCRPWLARCRARGRGVGRLRRDLARFHGLERPAAARARHAAAAGAGRAGARLGAARHARHFLWCRPPRRGQGRHPAAGRTGGRRGLRRIRRRRSAVAAGSHAGGALILTAAVIEAFTESSHGVAP